MPGSWRRCCCPICCCWRCWPLVWEHAPERPVLGACRPAGSTRISSSRVATYGLLTIAAVAGFAVFLQERALKAKRPTALTRLLPPMAASETLELRLLAAAEAVLALGLLSGMAAEHFLGGRLLPLDHKTLFSLAAFVVIGALAAGAPSPGHPRAARDAARAARLAAAHARLSRRQIRHRRPAGLRIYLVSSVGYRLSTDFCCTAI